MTVRHGVSYDHLYIGGEWVRSSGEETIEVITPVTELPLGRVPSATNADVDRAVAAARHTFDATDWPTRPRADRVDVLRRLVKVYRDRSDQIATLITDEMGCPISLSRGMQAASPAMLIESYIEAAESFPFEEIRPSSTGTGLITREAVGVVAAVIPWNSPHASAMLKIAPALIAGCTVVLKPAPETAIDALLLGEMLDDAGVPAGVVNIVPADRAVSEYLVSHPGVDKVAFTGSTLAGRRIASICGNDLRRVTLELGGKSAGVVFADADLEASVAALRFGAMGNSGQMCVNRTRLLVEASAHDELVERLATMMDTITVGDPHDPATEVGPLVSARQRDRVEGYIRIGTDAGAQVVRGGGRPGDLDRGYYVEPTLLVGVENSMRIAQEEIFGPVVTVTPFPNGDEKEAIRLANDSEYGLAGSVYTSDLHRGLRVARQVRAGGLDVNGASSGLQSPMGGFRASGIGREMGQEGLASFVEVKSIGLPPGLIQEFASHS
ncbi:aldehyde dehydrogenase [Rhodococcoides yunnanense]|uniref:aldehyde dehydrogenase n=1 Tax=Rhodococcoides yunnanense TaxID=278209 RepID=UPI00093303E4|nr:aldehyde dehydrogenase [Rhodococcus yunnanensis]